MITLLITITITRYGYWCINQTTHTHKMTMQKQGEKSAMNKAIMIGASQPQNQRFHSIKRPLHPQTQHISQYCTVNQKTTTTTKSALSWCIPF